ncbi:MAG: FecR family protein [Bacteroidales bacterium]|nr:FecR family protein [Bacteroidales bacterium]
MVTQNKTNRNEIPDFVVEYLNKRDKFNDYHKVKEWLNSSSENRKTLDELIEIWQLTLAAESRNDYDEIEAWKHFKNSLKVTDLGKVNRFTAQKVFRLYKAVAAAAILFTIIVLSYYFIKNKEVTNQIYSEFIVPYGSKSKINLPDSSVVWMNAGSKLRYSNEFNRKNRDVYLSGEAYFEINPAKKPFTINTSRLRIKSLNTRFNVKAYPEEKFAETTVMEGSVEIQSRASGRHKTGKLILKAGQQVALAYKTANETDSVPAHTKLFKTAAGIIEPAAKVIVHKIENPERISSWKDDRWIITSEELQSLAKKLERKYDVSIVFDNEALKKYVFSGLLKDETLEQVLEAIKLTAPIGFKLEKDTVSLYEITVLKSKLQQAPE